MSRFYRLKNLGNDHYVIPMKKYFKGFQLSFPLEDIYDFAYEMTLGGKGYERPYRSGGSDNRELKKQFEDTFQGKLAEFAVYHFLKDLGIEVTLPDVRILPKGQWDDVDLIANDKKISVKSIDAYSNLLLLETKDWNNEGHYCPNKEKQAAIYDYFTMCRIFPSIEKIIKRNTKPICLKDLLCYDTTWSAEISGYITLEDLKYLINNHYVIKKDSILGRNTLMDADNYYCMVYDMRNINELIDILRK